MATLKIQEMHRTTFAVLMGTAVAVVFAALHLAGALARLENTAYDQRFRWLARRELASREVVVINIDNASFSSPGMTENVGRWPWRRNLYALLLHYLRQAPARAIGIDIIFAGPDEHEGDDARFAEMLAAAPDTVLAFSLNQSRTWYAEGQAPPEHAELRRSAWNIENAGCAAVQDRSGFDLPLARLSEKARALGCITQSLDSDGILRRMPLLFRYEGRYYPSLALALAAPFLPGTPPGRNNAQASGQPRAEFRCSGPLRIGSPDSGWREIPVERPGGNVGIYWYGSESAVRTVEAGNAGGRRGPDEIFRHYPVWQIFDSAVALANGEQPPVPPAEFKDKIVLIGPSAAGIGDHRATPFSPATAGVEIQATMISNLLEGHFVRAAGRGWALVAIALLAVATSLAMWRFADWRAYTSATLGLAAAYVAVNFALFYRAHAALELVAPLGALAVSYTAGNLTRYLTEGREKKRYRSTLMKYVAPQLVEAIMHNPRMAELHNDKLDLTVLFSDVRGFTSLSEKIPVSELVATLNEFLNAMVEVIFRNGGTLDKFVGDCVMAIWGAPVRQENHAEMAARTALEMQAALEKLNENWRRLGRPELKIGVGINSGEMIFGNIGSERRMDFTVIGDNVNLASRLESATKELKASIVISDATYQRIASLAEVRELGTIHVKGKDVPIRVYELLGMSGKEQPSYAGAHASHASV